MSNMTRPAYGYKEMNKTSGVIAFYCQPLIMMLSIAWFSGCGLIIGWTQTKKRVDIVTCQVRGPSCPKIYANKPDSSF